MLKRSTQSKGRNSDGKRHNKLGAYACDYAHAGAGAWHGAVCVRDRNGAGRIGSAGGAFLSGKFPATREALRGGSANRACRISGSLERRIRRTAAAKPTLRSEIGIQGVP